MLSWLIQKTYRFIWINKVFCILTLILSSTVVASDSIRIGLLGKWNWDGGEATEFFADSTFIWRNPDRFQYQGVWKFNNDTLMLEPIGSASTIGVKTFRVEKLTNELAHLINVASNKNFYGVRVRDKNLTGWALFAWILILGVIVYLYGRLDDWKRAKEFNLTKVFAETQAEKKSYVEKLEEAQKDDVFRYMLLMNASALEGYVTQARIQAEQSFKLSKVVALLGFGLLCVGIAMGILFTLAGNNNLSAAYLASIAGVLAEFISGVFFYLYNKSLQQINLFHDKITTSQQISMSFLANSLVEDDLKRDQSKIDLAKDLMLSLTKKG
jgi:hypothetical protein